MSRLDSSNVEGLAVRGLRVQLADVIVALLVAGVALSEAALYLEDENWALGGHLGVLIVCTIAMYRLSDHRDLFQALALFPVFRIVNLAMPVFVDRTLYWFPLVYGAMIPALVLYTRHQSTIDLGRSQIVAPLYRWVAYVIAAPVIAFQLAVIEHAILQPEALVAEWTIVEILSLVIVMVLFVGVVEEWLFRGIIQRAVGARYGRWTGVVLTSALFGLMHSGYGVPAEVAFAAGTGLMLGVLYEVTDNLAFVAITHGILNIVLFSVLPLGMLNWLIGA